MKLLKRYSVLIALASLLWTSASMADGAVVVLDIARADHDQRTGKPILTLIFAKTSEERLRKFGDDNVGQKVEFLVNGQVLASPVLREPIGGQFNISNSSWTEQEVVELARQFSEAPKGEVEIRRSLPSK
jgi:preprotein translocase subunit SecD